MRQLKINRKITNRESKSLDRYFQEISKVRLITADEEIILAKKVLRGDQVALIKMINANLRFVVSVAKQYQNKGLSLGDLINEGNYGLVKAAFKFDVNRGFKFISYAVWWIRQAIIQALSTKLRMIRLPLNRVSSIYKISTKHSILEQILQRDPTPEELAEELNMTSNEIANNLKISTKHLSLNAPFGSDENNSLLDVLENNQLGKPDDKLLLESLQNEIHDVLTTVLTSVELMIITGFFGLDEKPPQSLEQISTNFNFSRERVRQIKQRAILKLRNSSHSNILKTHLGQF